MAIRPLQYTEIERARIQQQLKALADAIAAGGGGGGSSGPIEIADVTGLQTALNGKQATLVSGTSIKTVNGTSLLGSGDIEISGGGGASPIVSWVI